MEQAKSAIGAFFGLTPVETELLIQNVIMSIKPVAMILARLAFVIGFICCIIEYTLAGIFIGILGWYLIQLEKKVETLERQVKALLNVKYDYS